MLDTVISHYKKLGVRERILTIVFASAIVATLYHRFLYRPFAGNAGTYKFQVQKLTTRLDELNAKLPQIDKQKERLRLISLENETIVKNIESLEKKLPNKRDASRLTGELARLTKDLELVSVQQRIDEGETYSRIYVDLTFNAQYKDIVDYMKRAESISPFLKIEEMDISEPKGKIKGPGVTVRLLLSCLLGETPISEWLYAEGQAKVEEAEVKPEMRDIFISRSRPIAIVDKKDFRLSGITFGPEYPTAIINDDVVKIGSEIGGFKVKTISPDAVILTNGVEEFFLTIER